jgi:hypothetical protein
MAFKRTIFSQRPDEIISDDRFCQVELAIVFKRLTCYHCKFEGIYKYAVQQLRRHPEIQTAEDEEVREDHLRIWEGIPRFAEIPETVKCKRCREILAIDVMCVY